MPENSVYELHEVKCLKCGEPIPCCFFYCTTCEIEMLEKLEKKFPLENILSSSEGKSEISMIWYTKFKIGKDESKSPYNTYNNKSPFFERNK